MISLGNCMKCGKSNRPFSPINIAPCSGSESPFGRINSLFVFGAVIPSLQIHSKVLDVYLVPGNSYLTSLFSGKPKLLGSRHSFLIVKGTSNLRALYGVSKIWTPISPRVPQP